MSITDEDLQFMADEMWKDALLPDLPQMDESQNGNVAPEDTLLDPAQDLMKPAGSSANKRTTSAAKATKPTKGKGKGKEVALAPPATDLYLGSPVLVHPKKDGKMSKSMKGASQNESQREKLSRPPKPHKTASPQCPNPMFPELETTPDDPYGLPLSPVQTVAVSNKKKVVSPVVSTAKKTSPFGLIGGGLSRLIPTSVKRPAKPQKRVAKRSFLDPPSSPAGEPMMTGALPPPKTASKAVPPPAAAVKQPARAARKPAAPRKAARPREPKKTAARPRMVKKERTEEPEGDWAVKEPKTTVIRPPVVKKEVTEEPEDERAAPALDGVLPEQNVIKKLRPRGERAPIIISSDSASSYEDDDDESDSGYAQDTSMTSVMTPVDQMDLPESIQKPTKAPTVANQKMPAPNKATKVTAVQKHAEEEQGESISRGTAMPTFSVQPPEKQHAANSSKRALSPSAAPVGRPETKKLRTEPARAEKKRALVQPTDASDPFVKDGEDRAAQQQTHFTAKLLQSAAPTVQPTQKYSVKDQPCRHGRDDLQPDSHQDVHQNARQDTHQDILPGSLYEVPRSHQASYRQVPSNLGTVQPNHAKHNSRAMDSDGIARQMMQLLTASAGANSPAKHNASPRDAWLNETDPYKETGQIMTYVCRTVLRFLKSKEAAIQDVADEYRERGGAVLSSLDKLHAGERCALAQSFEQRRQRALGVFDAAQRDVQLLAGKLERVNLVPVIQDVLADTAASRMRALQAEMV